MTELELTVKQAAHALGIAERTCRKWLEEGRLEGRKDRKGNRDVWRIPAEACRKVRPAKGSAEPLARQRPCAVCLQDGLSAVG